MSRKVILLEEISWCQKSRVLWLKKEDQHTKIFHIMVNFHRTNTIKMVSIDGVACLKAPVICNQFVDFFKHLLTGQVRWQPKYDGLMFDFIRPQNASWLERSFEDWRLIMWWERWLRTMLRTLMVFQWDFSKLAKMWSRRTWWRFVKNYFLMTNARKVTIPPLLHYSQEQQASKESDYRLINLVNGGV